MPSYWDRLDKETRPYHVFEDSQTDSEGEPNCGVKGCVQVAGFHPTPYDLLKVVPGIICRNLTNSVLIFRDRELHNSLLIASTYLEKNPDPSPTEIDVEYNDDDDVWEVTFFLGVKVTHEEVILKIG